MATDDERREVAERLRCLRKDTDALTNLNHGIMWSLAWCVLGDDLDEFGPTDWFERMCARLADLIDPDCDEGRYSVARTVRPVDREALLAIADEIDAAYVEAAQMLGLPRAADEGTVFSRLIREACGEEVA